MDSKGIAVSINSIEEPVWIAVLWRAAKCAVLLLVLSIYLCGCSNKFLDPTQVGRFRPVPAVNVILDSLGVAEEEPPTWAGAEEPKPIDVMVYETDYVFSPGDIVRISIFELLREGIPYANDYIITETGKISIPEVGIVEATGLTESQLEEEVRQILSPSILKEPSVAVTLMNSEKRTFSISGDGIPRPSRYGLPRYDFRLLDALAVAGGVSQFNISYIYVSRKITGKEVISETVEPQVVEPEQPRETQQLIRPQDEMMEIIAPRASRQKHIPSEQLLMTSTEMITDNELAEAALPEGFELPTNNSQNAIDAEAILQRSDESIDWQVIKQQDTEQNKDRLQAEPVGRSEQEHIEWIFQNGKWVPVYTGQPEPRAPEAVKAEKEKAAIPFEEKIPEDFGWGDIGTGGVQTRVIKIPADKLTGGDPRYNIVMRPGDSIQVPVDVIGEFCIMGNVNGQGFIPLTGRPMTLKMAIAAAGGLGPLAWPKRCEVVRRIGKKKEEVVMVDLEKIASGEQPDFFIKPNDLINVGTHPTARWRAVLRNAFRATYGFGFIYDRNFADRDFGTSRPIPNWF